MFEERPIPKIKMGVPRKPVEGHGINDAPYYTQYTDASGNRLRCPFYVRWLGLLQRVFNAKFHAAYPTYINCTIDPSWLSFNCFRKWMQSQDWKDKELDKDLLEQGNKHYGPDTCMFVTPAINKLLCLAGNARGAYPLGVHTITRRGKVEIRAFCRFYGKKKNLGTFTSIDDAAAAYKQTKLNYIKELAANETDLRVRQALLRLY